MLIRVLDQKEVLVRLFSFHQDEGQEGYIGDFHNALMHHKTTYYVAGLLALLVILGASTSLAACVMMCFKLEGNSREGRNCGFFIVDLCCRPVYGFSPYGGFYARPVCCECTECCVDCARCCADGDCSLAVCCKNCGQDCGRTCDLNMFRGGGGSNRGDDCVALLAIVIIAFIVIGILAAIVALVTAVQRALAKLAKIQQFRVLAEEYVVRDLADPTDLGDATSTKPAAENMHPPVPEDHLEQQKINMQLSKDINAIYEGTPLQSESLRNASTASDQYGAVQV